MFCCLFFGNFCCGQPTAAALRSVITAALQALGANVEQSSECKGSARIRS